MNRASRPGPLSAGQVLAITGGAGRIATALRPLLREHYRLRLLDIRSAPDAMHDDEYRQLDVAQLDAVEPALAGAHAVLHLAANASTTASWTEVRDHNIDATFAVFEAARRAGIRKVVFASSNHVMGFAHLERAWPIATATPIRPDSLYGVSKAFGEALARYYADAFDMSMLCLRIGWFPSQDPDRADLQGLWISARDLAQITLRCLQTPRRFGIYNATSDNPHRHWSLDEARDELGYTPVDSVANYPARGEPVTYVDPQAGVMRGRG